MFSGIIEECVVVEKIELEGTNKSFWFSSNAIQELKIDQSIAHNGVCLTVDKLEGEQYRVTAIEETLSKTNLNRLAQNDKVNIERCLRLNDRLDGHIVQGHVDCILNCVDKKTLDGSWIFTFNGEALDQTLVVERGSICINGVSLTIADITDQGIKVAIIPYTYEFTNFNHIKIGDEVNIEFDILGKYIQRHLEKTMATNK